MTKFKNISTLPLNHLNKRSFFEISPTYEKNDLTRFISISRDCPQLSTGNQFRLLDNRLLNYTLCGEIPISRVNRLGALIPVFSLHENYRLRFMQDPDARFMETQGSTLLNALDLKAYKNTSGHPNQFEMQSHLSGTFKYVYTYFPSSKAKMIWERQEDKSFKLPYVPGLLSTVSSMLSNARLDSSTQHTSGW